MKRILVLLLCLFPVVASAQPNPTVQKEAIEKMGFLVGNWEGEGWMMMGPGNKTEFKGTEKVEWMLGGVIIRVEGKHYEKDATTSDEPVHHAFGVFSYDDLTSEYNFQTYLATGRSAGFRAQMEDGAIVWGFDMPQGTIRYTIRLNEKGEWFEVGHFKPKGMDQWIQNFEMTLHRVD